MISKQAARLRARFFLFQIFGWDFCARNKAQLGDVHASQGDTEYTGTAAETCATVRVRLELLKQKRLPFMRIEKPDALIAVQADRPLEQAVDTATKHLIEWLVEEHNLAPTDAYCLVSTCPDFRINVYQ
ncbi:MAG: hypothetical protein VX705_06235, partial [Verrucomicrobiota bacterium]|nr:hypothetical protein [Verrucomicrobiota bacterium]